MLAYVCANKLIKGSHPRFKYRGIRTYPEISGDQPAQKNLETSGPNMLISTFAMTIWSKQIQYIQYFLSTFQISNFSFVRRVKK